MFIHFFFKRKEGGERNTNVRNIDPLPHVHAPTRNRTHNLLVCGMVLQPSHLARVKSVIFFKCLSYNFLFKVQHKDYELRISFDIFTN